MITMAFAVVLALIILMPVNAGVGPREYDVTPDYVESVGICSCSLMTHYTHEYSVFENYCPNCGGHGTLLMEIGPASYTSPERE